MKDREIWGYIEIDRVEIANQIYNPNSKKDQK
jgi:hypothetical protein